MTSNPKNLKVKFRTLGCRLNQYETQAMREQFRRASCEETEDSAAADIFVLNTCTVTQESDRQNRYWIRKFHRENPRARIVVTGCYVERNRQLVQSLPGVAMTVLNQEKDKIVDLFAVGAGFPPNIAVPACRLPAGQAGTGRDPPSLVADKPAPTCISAGFDVPSRRRFTPLAISEFEGRRRAYLKIQDGCNHACSFCKVVLVRGPSRSRPVTEVLEEAKRLRDHGFHEIILTGIQLGAYGYDLVKAGLLPRLLEELSRVSGLSRIRLSSIEPTDVTEALMEAMAKLPHICPHLHIPLQSGDDQVLKRMNRRYTSGFYRDLIERLRSRLNDFVLTTDVMIGFPGETDEQFQHTVDLLLTAEPYQLHVFPFSAREGTRAARFSNFIPPDLISKRRNVLELLETKLKRQVEERFLNVLVEVVVEDSETEAGWAEGRAANYLKILFPAEHREIGSLKQVRIERIGDTHLIGTLITHEVEHAA